MTVYTKKQNVSNKLYFGLKGLTRQSCSTKYRKKCKHFILFSYLINLSGFKQIQTLQLTVVLIIYMYKENLLSAI